MTTTPSTLLPRHAVDGLLVEAGERLFRRPRSGQDDSSARTGIGAGGTRRPLGGAEVRAEVRAFLRPGAQVMVKITGGGRGMRAMGAHLRYISRQGQDEVGGKGRTLEVIDERGERHQGREAMQELIADWRTAGSFIPEVSHRREAFHIIFSMPAGTRSDALLESVQATAKHLYDGHRYVMALHTDQGAPHVHVMVRAEGMGQKRLNPRKADLDHWRATFARELQTRGVDAVATRQATRFLVNRSYPALWEKQAAAEGRLKRQRSDTKTGEKATEARVTAGYAWRQIATALAKSADPEDQRLAVDVLAAFQREASARGLLRPVTERAGPVRGDRERAGPGPRASEREIEPKRERRGPER